MPELKEFFESSLHPVAEYYLMNSITVRQYYNDNWFKGVDENELVDEAVCMNIHIEEVQQMLFMSVHFVNKLLKTDPVKKSIGNIERQSGRTFYLVTFTSDPEKDEVQNICDITKYRQNHFKKYKYVYAEEKDSSNSKKYHQHILIECPLKVVHTKQNLKPAGYYKGNINVKRVTATKPSVDRVLEYLSKEKPAKGDVDYFLNLQF